MKSLLALVISSLLMIGCMSVHASAAETCCKEAKCKICVFEIKVIRLCNEERERRGIHPLKRAKELVTACRKHSAVQKAKRSMHHGSLRGCSAENVACGQETEEQVVRAWMNSSGHRANILNRSWRFIGYGRSSCGRYHTQQFK